MVRILLSQQLTPSTWLLLLTSAPLWSSMLEGSSRPRYAQCINGVMPCWKKSSACYRVLTAIRYLELTSSETSTFSRDFSESSSLNFVRSNSSFPRATNISSNK